MQFRPYRIDRRVGWRFHGRPVDLGPGLPFQAMLDLPRTLDVEGVEADGSQSMPGGGFLPFGSQLQVSVVASAAVPNFVLRVVRQVAGRAEPSFTDTNVPLLKVAPPGVPNQATQTAIILSGFTTDAFALWATADVACQATVFGFCSWSPVLHVATPAGAVIITQPTLV